MSTSHVLAHGFDRMTSVAASLVEEQSRRGPGVVAARRGASSSHVLALAHVERVRLRLAFEHAAEASILVDRRGIIRVTNAHARALFPRLVEPGEGVVGVFVDADRERAAELVRRRRSEEILLTARADGEERAIRVRVEELDEDRAAWTLSPATASTPDLERALRDTRELLERERRRSAALEVANRSMKRLLMMLSHDLRGPINAVLGWTDLLRREPLGRGGRDRALAAIVKSARTQAALVDELLDVARMTEGRLHVDLRVFDLAAVARQAVEAILPDAGSAGLTVGYAAPPGGAAVVGDVHRTEQILSNLLSNALKYSPSGGRIDVVIDQEADRVRLDVRDTGRGISAELLPRIFDWLTQDAAKSEDARRGLGLGLYIVKQLAELQGGSVLAKSGGPGRGSTFTVYLRAASAGLLSPEDLPEQPDARGAAPLQGRSVLLVGDDEANVELLAMIVRSRGAHILHGRSIADAAALVEHERPAVVVCDFDEHDPARLADAVASLRRVARGAEILVVAPSAAPIAGVDPRRRLLRPLEPRAVVDAIVCAADAANDAPEGAPRRALDRA